MFFGLLIRQCAGLTLRAGSVTMACMAVCLLLGTRGFYVYGSCMEPNLRTGERVLANRTAYWFAEPSRGDVVVFRYPANPRVNYVKRVVGLPGDRVEMRNGVLFVNGRVAPEPYKQLRAHGDYGPELVKPGCLFVLGDNRDQSNDSRYWGELPLTNLEGRAVLRYWPLARARVLD